MRFKYSTTHSRQSEIDSLPRLPLLLQSGGKSLEVIGLVDSGATINVLPFSIGQHLGGVWDERKATVKLAGNLARSNAQPLVLQAQVGETPPILLAFAWASHDETPVILGQMNFFLEFEVCFFREKLEFEVKLKNQH